MGTCVSKCVSLNEKRMLSPCTLKNTPWLNFQGQRKPMKVVSIYDADTITVAFRLNGYNYLESMRLEGIDAAEMKPRKDYPQRELEKKHALLGKERMEELCLDKLVSVDCGGWEKFGRLLGTVYTDDGTNVNELLLRENLAYPYDGKKKKAFHEWYDPAKHKK